MKSVRFGNCRQFGEGNGYFRHGVNQNLGGAAGVSTSPCDVLYKAGPRPVPETGPSQKPLQFRKKPGNILPSFCVEEIQVRQMSTDSRHTQGQRPGIIRKAIWQLLVVSLVGALMPGVASAERSAVIRSLILPGTGQAHEGHYTKAAIFSGAAIISGAGLFVSQIQYNRAVDDFNSAQDKYNEQIADWQGGEVLSSTFLNSDLEAMQSASDDADTRLKWRNFFLGTLVATYTLNLIDILMSKPHNPETAMRYTVEANPKRVLLVRSFSF
jgi:Family of unknown function (DUF5683)